jgi:hypothetical protein
LTISPQRFFLNNLNRSCDEWRMDGTTMLPRFFSIRKSTYWKNFWRTEIEPKKMPTHTTEPFELYSIFIDDWSVDDYPDLWVRIPLRQGKFNKTLCDKVCQWLNGSLVIFSPVSSTNKTDRHDITEILLKVALNTKTLT